MAQFKINEIVRFLKLLATAVTVISCFSLTACLDLEEDEVSSTAANEDEPGAKDRGQRIDGLTGLFAEEIKNLSKTDVYGAFANHYSLMYEDFSYQNDTIPMPFPLTVANLCESSKEICQPKTVVIKSWISGFTDTSTTTLLLDVNEDTIISPTFTFDDDALFALTSPKKAERHVEAFAFENGQKNYFYANSASVTIHPMQVFGDNEEAFGSDDYRSMPQLRNYWYSVFVTPEADSILAMVGEVAKKLPRGELLVYQQYPEDESVRESLLRVVEAVFGVLQSRGITYIEETGSSSVGQRINYPVETLRKKQGICIETAVLFASVLERLGFDVRIIMIPGHAFIGWMTEKGGNVYDFVETTMIGDRNVTFEAAYYKGFEEFNEQVELKNFESGASSIVYINLAREAGIIPNNVP